jgi:hypothetical protein
MVGKSLLNANGLGQDVKAGFCELCNDASGSITEGPNWVTMRHATYR